MTFIISDILLDLFCSATGFKCGPGKKYLFFPRNFLYQLRACAKPALNLFSPLTVLIIFTFAVLLNPRAFLGILGMTALATFPSLTVLGFDVSVHVCDYVVCMSMDMHVQVRGPPKYLS